MEGDHTHNLIYLALLCIVCTQASFSDYVSIKNQSIQYLNQPPVSLASESLLTAPIRKLANRTDHLLSLSL